MRALWTQATPTETVNLSPKGAQSRKRGKSEARVAVGVVDEPLEALPNGCACCLHAH